MSEPQAPLLEFPCDYPIKVLGSADSELHQHVLQVMDTHAPALIVKKLLFVTAARASGSQLLW